MLTKRELATIRAALLFWNEEIAIHDPRIAIPYLEDHTMQPLETKDVERLRSRFVKVRYIPYDARTDTLLSKKPVPESERLELTNRRHQIATLILPA